MGDIGERRRHSKFVHLHLLKLAILDFVFVSLIQMFHWCSILIPYIFIKYSMFFVHKMSRLVRCRAHFHCGFLEKECFSKKLWYSLWTCKSRVGFKFYKPTWLVKFSLEFIPVKCRHNKTNELKKCVNSSNSNQLDEPITIWNFMSIHVHA